MSEVVVAYSVNQAFLLPCAVSLTSLVRRFEASPAAAGQALRIYVFHDAVLSDADAAMLALCARSAVRQVSVDVRPFDYRIPPLLCDAPQWNNIETVATLLLPDILRQHPRLLFIDADTLVVGDVMELWATDLGGRPCACVPDYDATSPNTGVIVYDVHEWNRRDLTNRCLTYVSTHRTFHVDQEPFTAVDGAEFLPLDRKWNYHGVDTWMYKRFGANLPADDVRILHFNGPPRPWHAGCPRRYARLWQAVYRQTPLAGAALPHLTMRDFLSFRMSPLEVYLGESIARHKLYLLPYLVLRRLRMTAHYVRYWLSVRAGPWLGSQPEQL